MPGDSVKSGIILLWTFPHMDKQGVFCPLPFVVFMSSFPILEIFSASLETPGSFVVCYLWNICCKWFQKWALTSEKIDCTEIWNFKNDKNQKDKVWKFYYIEIALHYRENIFNVIKVLVICSKYKFCYRKKFAVERLLYGNSTVLLLMNY